MTKFRLKRKTAVDAARAASPEVTRPTPRIVADLRQFIDPAVVNLMGAQIVGQFTASGRRGLAVCGTTPGAGASFISLHFAAALALTGRRTLLIDADMRTPDAGKPFTHQRPDGLADWLNSEDYSIYPSQIEIGDGLFWLPAGRASEFAGDLVSGQRFRRLTDVALRDFDAVLLDTPPANAWADSRGIARMVGRALIVARRHYSYVNDVVALRRELEEDEVEIFGAILNEG